VSFIDDEDPPEEDVYQRENLIHENVLTTFGSPQGEFTLSWLYDLVRMGKSTFVPGAPDQTAFNEGKRWVVLQIMGQMRIDDEELFRRARRVTRQLENIR
jgi:hypothetical protein